jgi:hypothetical protein
MPGKVIFLIDSQPIKLYVYGSHMPAISKTILDHSRQRIMPIGEILSQK